MRGNVLCRRHLCYPLTWHLGPVGPGPLLEPTDGGWCVGSLQEPALALHTATPLQGISHSHLDLVAGSNHRFIT